ncbi:hypothetical protein SAMN06265348_101569 [Pedobacter westerhofensis]|uniref:Uncharacterized protein n=1 Tax=Pedobacter westerhofensis TaxID=425512 RepID=A0A521AZR3_9SPHI|nr:hypothetical protein [Pedobacter westerhofensis]SMO40322.1 hypothetical protein SAMN06265348_101569 [Pedobacter westerhofensis]
MTHQEESQENTTTKHEQLTLLFAHYGRAIYVAQVLEQETINMVAIDEIVTTQPESETEYDTIWAKYDNSKKMMGIMTSLLQQAYEIDELDMEELKALLALKTDLANIYFRFNDLTVATGADADRMISDFVGFNQRVQMINEKLSLYREAYNTKTGVTAEQHAAAYAARKEEFQGSTVL